MDLSSKLKQLRKAKKVTQEELAQAIGVERSTVGKYETGVCPSPDILVSIADFFETTVDDLLGRDVPPDTLPPFDNIFRIEKKKFPLLGDIACGTPIYADEDHESYIMADADIVADFCLRAKGDSMTGARIRDGDIVFVRESPIVNNGEIAAVIIGDEATLKRVYYSPEKSKLILSPENPKYAPLVYIGEELNNVRILGKAVAFQSLVI